MKGTKSGAAIGRPRAVFDRSQAIAMRAAGASWRAIAATFGVGVGTVRRTCEGVPKPLPPQSAADGELERVAVA